MRVLLANNGLCAYKFCISIRKSRKLGNVYILGLATEEDLKNNAHFIRHVDGIEIIKSEIILSDISALLNIAKTRQCDTVFPGWGRISESPDFSRACRDAGLIFVGPPCEASATLGDKAQAILLAEKCGIPVLQWSGPEGLQSSEDAACACDDIGFPCVLKTSVSGGGRGVRRVNTVDEALNVYQKMKTSDDVIFAMKCAENMRHVELQVVGDKYGNFKILGARDCSVQRRHQKLVEEAPPPDLDARIFTQVANQVIEMMKQAQYSNLGTAEFLYDRKSLYFLEVNCRLQVEHCVTEALYDLNLPEIQLLIAQGASINDIPGLSQLPQVSLVPKITLNSRARHVIASRIVAESPGDFRPCSGEVYSFSCPDGYFSISSAGGRISASADSQVGHVVAVGDCRETAIDRLVNSLNSFRSSGQVPLQEHAAFVAEKILSSPEFRSATHSTDWLETSIAGSFQIEDSTVDPDCLAVAIVLLARGALTAREEHFYREVRRGIVDAKLPLATFSTSVVINGKQLLRDVEVRKFIDGRFSLFVRGQDISTLAVRESSSGTVLVSFNLSEFRLFSVTCHSCRVEVSRSNTIRVQVFEASGRGGILSSPFGGRIQRWMVEAGQSFNEGEVICDIECMKMVCPVRAVVSGVIAEIVNRDTVSVGDTLALLSVEGNRLTEFSFPFAAFSGSLNESISLNTLINSELKVCDPRVQPELWLRMRRTQEACLSSVPIIVASANHEDLGCISTHVHFTSSDRFAKLTLAALAVVGNPLEQSLARNILGDARVVEVQNEDIPKILSDYRLMRWLKKSSVHSIRSSRTFLQLKPWVELQENEDFPLEPDDKRAKALTLNSTCIQDFPSMLQKALSLHGGCLQEISRLSEANCGLRSWKCQGVLGKTTFHFIFVANDSLHKNGSFSVEEACVFIEATKSATEGGIPLLFFQCNSGARLELCDKLSQIAMPSRHDEEVHLAFPDTGEIDDFYSEPLNQENLAASARMARAMTLANESVFTASFISGRAVGIGAYLARLGSRVIQRRDSCIILTGYKALNKLIGAEAYVNNSSLGGWDVLGSNGVTSVVVDDDLEGVVELTRWMLFHQIPRQTCLDCFDRVPDDDPTSLFDEGSFVEYQAKYSPSLIIGRARLAGVSIGVVFGNPCLVDTVTSLADPGDSETSDNFRRSPGQILLPSSSYKFAQAVRDFRGEGLPIFIFANFRGFSSGRRDMHDEILKFGSMIIEELVKHPRPIFVYIPPRGQLRGGSWVVMDKGINPTQIELFADPSARGGVMEPEGSVAVKFKPKHHAEWKLRSRISDDAVIHKAAILFADMHDTPQRMLRVGVIDAIVPWAEARSFFCGRILQRMSFI